MFPGIRVRLLASQERQSARRPATRNMCHLIRFEAKDRENETINYAQLGANTDLAANVEFAMRPIDDKPRAHVNMERPLIITSNTHHRYAFGLPLDVS